MNGYRSPDSGVACAIDWAPDAGSVTTAAARSAAEPVLAAAGLSAAPTDVGGDAPMRSVSAKPVVDGRPSDGFGTTVQVRPSGVAMAGGWLAPATGALTAVGTYPLRSAKDAFDDLDSLPGPEIACAPQPNSCPLDRHVIITGAFPGLMSAWEDGSRPLLVPSWIFTVSGQADGPAQNALDAAYLRTPANQDGGADTTPPSTRHRRRPSRRRTAPTGSTPWPRSRSRQPRWRRRSSRRTERPSGTAQWNESPQAQEPVAFGLSIVKPCFSIVSTKSIVAPPQVGRAHPVDDDVDAAEVGDHVAVELTLVEEELVAQARAAARLHGDAQRQVVAALLVEQRLDLGGRGVGDDDAGRDPGVGRRLGGGLVLDGHLSAPCRSRLVWAGALHAYCWVNACPVPGSSMVTQSAA